MKRKNHDYYGNTWRRDVASCFKDNIYFRDGHIEDSLKRI